MKKLYCFLLILGYSRMRYIEFVTDMSTNTLISYGGNQYSVPSEYAGRDVAVVALDNMLTAYYEGKQIALHNLR